MTNTVAMPDAIGGDSIHLPASTPKVAYYITGNGIAWTTQDLERFGGVKVPIDQSDSTEPFLDVQHLVKDIENGASTLTTAVTQAKTRATHGLPTTWYVAAGTLRAARALAVAHQLTGFVDYWVANWNLNEAEAAALLGGDIVAIQWASPTSNPDTLVPGSRLTLRQANVDLSVTLASWFPATPSKPKPKVHPKITAAGLAAAITTAAAAAVHAAGVHLTPVETGAITTLAAVLAGYLKGSHA